MFKRNTKQSKNYLLAGLILQIRLNFSIVDYNYVDLVEFQQTILIFLNRTFTETFPD